jgi:hypothetical protein
MLLIVVDASGGDGELHDALRTHALLVDQPSPCLLGLTSSREVPPSLIQLGWYRKSCLLATTFGVQFLPDLIPPIRRIPV